MSWSLVTNAWRLKLLAVALAILMLSAVAFSENPPTTKTLHGVAVNYTVADGIVLMNPPTTIDVTVSGLADVLESMNDANPHLSAVGDASHARPGVGVKVGIRVISTVNVQIQQPAPVAVNVETLQVKEVPVQIAVRAAPGWSVTKAVATCPGSSTPSPCAVHFSGPASWETNLTASAVVPETVSVGKLDSLNRPIQLSNSNGALNLSSAPTTFPPASLDVNSVNVHVEAQTGITSTTVPLVDAPPSQGPAAGYRITAVTISPATVVLTGDIGALSGIHSITLPPVDLSGATSDTSFQVTIPYRNGVSGSVATATVRYSISRNPNA
jgi:YbbR domain-containing protein